tara:strand:+ start:2024 stop:2161 length:138 start_codon:yes stop_codon:yes gene_type:complete
MGFKLLEEYLYFEKNKENYTEIENEEIIKNFKNQLKNKSFKLMIV